MAAVTSLPRTHPDLSARAEPGDDVSPLVVQAPTRPARVLIAAVRLYQLFRAGRTSPCRFTPSCSVYTVEALSRHGARRGLALAVRRLGRCRPWGPFGLDPVPE